MLRTISVVSSLSLVGTLTLFTAVGNGQSQDRSSAESALVTMFSPRRAPSVKTMGLLQRSFLDLVEASHPKLQVALVIDGTESMSGELEGIRRALGQMVGDLSRYKGSEMSFQLLIFRDAGASSEVEFPLATAGNAFTGELNVLEQALGRIQPASGAPYFPELVDLGIHKALTELDWSSDPDTTRWVLVFGDAPPYPEGFAEAENKARRLIATNQLIATANRRDIRISCVLCPTRSQDQDIYRQVLPEAQVFMSRLATETGGLMLDLSFSDIRQALEKAAGPGPVSYSKIGHITRQDIESARQRVTQQQSLLAENRRTKIAVLPHLPLEQMVFDPAHEAVQVATEIRHRLRNVPGTELKSPVTVERQFEILRARGVRGDQILQALALALDVDYLVWGSLIEQPGTIQLNSAFYAARNGEIVVQDVVRAGPQQPVITMSGRLVANLANKTLSTNKDRRLVATFSSLRSAPAAQTAVVKAVAANDIARTHLLEGFEALEKALEYPVADAAGDQLLAQARQALDLAVKDDLSNPLAELLLANCSYNQFQSALRAQRPEEAQSHREVFEGALRKAYLFRDESSDFAYLKQEIEADYALLIEKDYAEAIRAYEHLAGTVEETPLHTAARAHWMLAGIYAGDWGIAQDAADLVDSSKSRAHLVEILAHWENSNEAKFIRKNIRWDDESGRSEFEFFPQTQQPRAETVDT